MSRFLFLVFIVALLPAGLHAKRAAPPKVEPVVHEGVRYTAPNDNGTRGYVVASEVSDGKKRWDVTVFRIHMIPFMEQDVQHVYIKHLAIRGAALVVTDEKGREFRVDLKTHKVQK